MKKILSCLALLTIGCVTYGDPGKALDGFNSAAGHIFKTSDKNDCLSDEGCLTNGTVSIEKLIGKMTLLKVGQMVGSVTSVPADISSNFGHNYFKLTPYGRYPGVELNFGQVTLRGASLTSLMEESPHVLSSVSVSNKLIASSNIGLDKIEFRTSVSLPQGQLGFFTVISNEPYLGLVYSFGEKLSLTPTYFSEGFMK